MELDEFKELYQARFEQVPAKSASDLEEILRNRSYTVIERIQRNMLYEVGGAFVIMLGLVVILATWSSTVFRWVGVSLVMLSVVQIVVFIGQYRQLSAWLNRPAASVRDHLQGLVVIVGRFVRAYYRFCMSSIPVGMVLGGYLGVTADTSDPAFAALPEKPTIAFTIISLLAAVLAVIGTYYLLNWYIHRLYGRYLDELNGCLRDLDEFSSSPAI